MVARTVLISGGGIAGSTLAWWLARNRFEVTVVEHSSGIRSSGNPVDVRGDALRIAAAMGVLDELRSVATHVTTLGFIDAKGRVARMRMSDVAGNGSDDVEVARRDLAAVLASAAQRESEFIFDDSIVTLAQDGNGVDVTFLSDKRRRFDLVIGADGTHSNTRRLAFGVEAEFLEYLGMFVATVPLPNAAIEPHTLMNYNEPGRLLSVHPANGTPIAAFIFRHAQVPEFDHHDVVQHRSIVAGSYAGGGWRTAELLDVVRGSADLYFDAVSRVRIANWASGRVALVGDAASSVTLFGEGSSMAIIGAKTLADALIATPDDHAGSFARYEAEHRERIPHARNVALAANFLVPKTPAGIALRNGGVRFMGCASQLRSR